MAWTSPITFATGEILTAAQMNTYLRDNLLETAPAKATTPGGIFVTTGANAIAERVPAGATVAASQSTTSSTFVNLATVGPSVTVNTGSQAIVSLYSAMSVNTSNNQAEAGYAVSGATIIAATSTRVIQIDGTPSGDELRIGATFFQSGLNPGVNTFTMQYRAPTAGVSATFVDRHIVVIPL